ncbi:TetR/AcrR family transcriptional regulator [Hoeflea ulvae]|uniref:TetR family transcriptional regulator C-terminal domain-containing protein n=1 Tax=Hoeflea ulvae TaxID=2983764 RepID=A0ABT3YIV3_9HYPH|nr:TetR family transcriptional regulator C-terminal domain-containing protein [Hoeflea ulvae]MCY0095830.1 TetR family transcriptional regulator C-terminal domain-containing protein [Hoeflea ulvae]
MVRQADDPKISPTSLKTQARMIEAVVDVVARHGISGTTFANVSAAAGVSQGALVFHFKSKDGLLRETLSRLLQEYEQAWSAAFAAPDPLTRILGLIRADFSPSICSRKKLALWFSFWGEAGAKPLYSKICVEAEVARYEAMLASCRDLVESSGGPDPVLLTNSIDAFTDGLWLQMHMQGFPITRAEALESALAHLRLLLPHHADQI